MHVAGIDEAGYGPTLGPLAVVAVRAEAEDVAALHAGFAAAATGVRDSKSLHTPGDVAPLERVALSALAWLTGEAPHSAAACFARLGESDADRAHAPWLAGAEELLLPVAATSVPRWSVPGVTGRGVGGSLVHPAAYNRILAGGANKAELELGVVGGLLSGLGCRGRQATVVDRLGGRRYYRDFLLGSWPEAMVLIEEETPVSSRYRVCGADGEHHVSFMVDGETASPLTAMASCIAKYARELHMLLFNRWWGRRVPGLKPTAGYPEDARRWLRQVDGYTQRGWDEVLIRRAGLEAIPGSDAR
jgi:ribonuclease HII